MHPTVIDTQHLIYKKTQPSESYPICNNRTFIFPAEADLNEYIYTEATSAETRRHKSGIKTTANCPYKVRDSRDVRQILRGALRRDDRVAAVAGLG